MIFIRYVLIQQGHKDALNLHDVTVEALAVPDTCECGKKGDGGPRIVGGQETEVHEYPWQVGMVSRNGRTPYCGGTLISATHVMTAAHCTEGQSASNIRILLGEHDISDNQFTRVDVAEIIQDPNFNSATLNSDFSILRLASPVTFTSAVSPACLPADLTETYAGHLTTVTGWGTLASGGNRPTTLQEVDVTVTTNAVCSNSYPGSITDVMICARDEGKDSCQGDSGGPLVHEENGRQALVRQRVAFKGTIFTFSFSGWSCELGSWMCRAPAGRVRSDHSKDGLDPRQHPGDLLLHLCGP
jgi:secreted trypsin-like serine protease